MTAPKNYSKTRSDFVRMAAIGCGRWRRGRTLRLYACVWESFSEPTNILLAVGRSCRLERTGAVWSGMLRAGSSARCGRGTTR